MELTLEPREAALLRRVLTDYLSELRMEVAGTEDYELREDLKGDEVVIKGLIARLEQAGAS